MLVTGQGVIRDAALHPKVFRVGGGVNASDRHDEPQTIGTCNFTPTPTLSKWQGGVVLDKSSIGFSDSICTKVILFDLRQPREGQRGSSFLSNLFQTEITGFRYQHRDHTRLEI